MSDTISSEVLENLEKKFIPGKPKLVYDFRESNLDKLEYYDDSITLNFNNSNGKFNLENFKK